MTQQTIFLTGATGAVGRPTVAALLAAGHDVRAAVRTDARAEVAARLGATPVVVDLYDVGALASAMAGSHALVNLATRIPTMTRAALPGAWKENDRIRREGSAALVEAAGRAGVGRVVQESVVFVYADGGDRWIDEDSPVDKRSVTESSDAAEANVARFAAQGGVGVVLRFGLFYGAGSSHTEAALAAVRKGLSPVLGARDGYQPSVHLDDAAAAVVAALAVPSGTYNVVDDEPVTKADYGHAIAAALGVKDPRLVPKGVVRLMGNKVNPISRSQRVSNRRFREASQWAPAHPSVVQGWQAVVAESSGVEGVGTDG